MIILASCFDAVAVAASTYRSKGEAATAIIRQFERRFLDRASCVVRFVAAESSHLQQSKHPHNRGFFYVKAKELLFQYISATLLPVCYSKNS